MNLVSLQVGMPRSVRNDETVLGLEGEWETGLFKDPVQGLVYASCTGLAGDGQSDVIHHGGHDKAINAYPEEHFGHWKKTLDLACKPGAFGENFTTRGLTESEVSIGDIFRIKDLTVQITQPRQPCWKLARRWGVKTLPALVQQTSYTGWYFRVLTEGQVEAPGVFELLDRPHPEWTVELANDIMYKQTENSQLARELAACPALSLSWKNMLIARADSQERNSESDL